MNLDFMNLSRTSAVTVINFSKLTDASAQFACEISTVEGKLLITIAPQDGRTPTELADQFELLVPSDVRENNTSIYHGTEATTTDSEAVNNLSISNDTGVLDNKPAMYSAIAGLLVGRIL